MVLVALRAVRPLEILAIGFCEAVAAHKMASPVTFAASWSLKSAETASLRRPHSPPLNVSVYLMVHGCLWFELPSGCPIQIHNREFS